jgi:curved DNA-binding protein CbpA
MSANLTQHMNALGVSPGASADMVKAAWRRAAKLSHPDLNKGAGTDRMKAINAAYEALKNGVPRVLDEPDRATPSARSHRPRQKTYVVRNGYFELSSDAKSRLAKEGLRHLQRKGFARPRQRLIDKMLMRPRPYPIFVPKSIIVHNGDFVITLDTRRLVEGTNYITIPQMRARGSGLSLIETFHTFAIQIAKNNRRPSLSRARFLETELLPGVTGYRAYICVK